MCSCDQRMSVSYLATGEGDGGPLGRPVLASGYSSPQDPIVPRNLILSPLPATAADDRCRPLAGLMPPERVPIRRHEPRSERRRDAARTPTAQGTRTREAAPHRAVSRAAYPARTPMGLSNRTRKLVGWFTSALAAVAYRVRCAVSLKPRMIHRPAVITIREIDALSEPMKANGRDWLASASAWPMTPPCVKAATHWS